MFEMNKKTSDKLRSVLLNLLPALYVFFYWVSHSDINILIPFTVSVLVWALSAALIYYLSGKYLSGKDSILAPMDATGKDYETKVPLRSVIILLLSSFSSLAMLSQSSPLYPINTWGDANIYRTVSEAMLHGQVLYRDIFDQKGPIQFALHMPGILISDTTFTGVYIVESICTFVFLFFICKIILLYTKPTLATDLLVFALPFILFSGSAFFQGDSAEELMLPFYAATIYLGLKALRENRLPNAKEAAIIGAVTGTVFWVKYTLCGIFLGFVIWMAVKLIRKKDFKELGKLALFFTAGFFAIAVPVFLYFAINNAIPDLINGYFVDNFVVYVDTKSDSGEMPLIVKLAFTFIFFFANCDRLIFVMIILGLLGHAFTARKGGAYSFLMTLFSFSIISVYIGGYTIHYYAVIFYSFAALAAVPFAVASGRFSTGGKGRVLVPAAVSLFCLAVIPAAFLRSENTYIILTPKSQMPQYRFAEYINGCEDKTLINYRFLDGGFYMATDTLPFIKHYCMYYDDTIRLEGQLNAIINHETHFIITRNECPEFNGYTIIDEATIESTFTGTLPVDNHVYYLYELTS